MDAPEPAPPSSIPPKMGDAGYTADSPLVSQSATIPPTARKNRTFLTIILITVGLLMLAVFAVVAFLRSITTAEVLQIDEDIPLPVSVNPRKREESKTGEYALEVKWQNGKSVYRFMEKDYEDEQAVVAELAKLKASAPHSRLLVRGDKRLPAMEIQRAMNILASAGFDTMTFSTLNRE